MRKIGALLCTAAIVATASMSHADTIEGKVVAYDRKAQLLVMEDRSIYSLAGYDAPLLAELEAGDMVLIETKGEGEDGYGLVTEITVQN